MGRIDEFGFKERNQDEVEARTCLFTMKLEVGDNSAESLLILYEHRAMRKCS